MSNPKEGSDRIDYQETPDDITEVHAAVEREKPEPSAEVTPMPMWLTGVCAVATVWAGLYFGIFNGGQRFNIVPDSAELQGTVRAFDEDMRQQALASLKNYAEHVAAANGATVEAEIPLGESTPVNNNDPALSARVRASLVKALGNEHVVEPQRWTAAEDFPHLGIGAHAPSVYFFVGSTSPGTDPVTAPSNHSPQFNLDESELDLGLRAMLQVTLDYLHGGKS